MEIPKNVKTYELSSSTLWKDEDGIWISIPKPGVPPKLTREQLLEETEKLKDIFGRQQVCLIGFGNPEAPAPNREERELMAEIFPKIVKAMAIVTTSPVSRMIANLFFGLKPPTYPTKMFSTFEEAKEWIMQYK
jgi:hypothetical protein